MADIVVLLTQDITALHNGCYVQDTAGSENSRVWPSEQPVPALLISNIGA